MGERDAKGASAPTASLISSRPAASDIVFLIHQDRSAHRETNHADPGVPDAQQQVLS